MHPKRLSFREIARVIEKKLKQSVDKKVGVDKIKESFIQPIPQEAKSASAVAQPTTAVAQPTTTVVQPTTTVVQPATTVVQPATTVVQPAPTNTTDQSSNWGMRPLKSNAENNPFLKYNERKPAPSHLVEIAAPPSPIQSATASREQESLPKSQELQAENERLRAQVAQLQAQIAESISSAPKTVISIIKTAGNDDIGPDPDNPESCLAYEKMKGSSPCLFITGKAGTGKSHLLRDFAQKN